MLCSLVTDFIIKPTFLAAFHVVSVSEYYFNKLKLFIKWILLNTDVSICNSMWAI